MLRYILYNIDALLFAVARDELPVRTADVLSWFLLSIPSILFY